LGSPLLMMNNVVLSPHIAGISVASQQSMLELAVGSVLDVLAGRECTRIVNPDAVAAHRDRGAASRKVSA
jgi:phosphoglycerate dehydrogenase-like enzyme